MDPMGIGSIHLNQPLILGTTSLNKPGAQAGSQKVESQDTSISTPQFDAVQIWKFHCMYIKNTCIIYTYIYIFKYKYDQESLNFIQLNLSVYIYLLKKKTLHEFQQATAPIPDLHFPPNPRVLVNGDTCLSESGKTTSEMFQSNDILCMYIHIYIYKNQYTYIYI